MESNKQGGRDGGRARLPASVDAGTRRRPGPWPPASARETGALAPPQAPPRRCSRPGRLPASPRSWSPVASGRGEQARTEEAAEAAAGPSRAAPGQPLGPWGRGGRASHLRDLEGGDPTVAFNALIRARCPPGTPCLSPPRGDSAEAATGFGAPWGE